MAFTQCSADVTNISSLHVRPNAQDGLNAAQLQAKFDAAGAAIKSYINGTLLAELEAVTAAENIGLDAENITASNVKDAFEELYAAIVSAEYGDIADYSLGSQKIANEAVIERTIKDGEVKTAKLADKAVTANKADDNFLALKHIPDRLITGDKIALAGVLPENTSGLQTSYTLKNINVPPAQWSGATLGANLSVDGITTTDFVTARVVNLNPTGYPSYTTNDVQTWGIYVSGLQSGVVTLSCKTKPTQTVAVQLVIMKNS